MLIFIWKRCFHNWTHHPHAVQISYFMCLSQQIFHKTLWLALHIWISSAILRNMLHSTIFLSRVSLILIFLYILIAPEISYKYVSISHPYNFQSPGPYFYLFLAINFLHLIYCQSFLLNTCLFHSRWHSWAPLILFFLMIANEV